MNSEIYSHLFDILFDKGALDVFLTNIIMKKSRPAIKLSVLCNEKNEKDLIEAIFKETTTLGVRKLKIERESLSRKFEEIQTKYGKVRIKISELNGEVLNKSPEFEDCKNLAIEHKIPIKKIYEEIYKKS
jgi:hypothetical protein